MSYLPVSTELAAFYAGAAWSYGTPKELLERPFSGMFNGAVGGGFAVFCWGLVKGFVPEQFNDGATCLLLISGTYYLVRSINCPTKLDLE